MENEGSVGAIYYPLYVLEIFMQCVFLTIVEIRVIISSLYDISQGLVYVKLAWDTQKYIKY